MSVREVLRTQYGSPMWLGTTLGLWGLWLIAPHEVFSASPTWDVMEELASEIAWGLIMLAGSIRLIQGAYRQCPVYVKEGAFVSTWMFFFIFSAITSGNWRTTGTPVYFMLTALSFYMFLKFRQEERELHARRSPTE